ncbi:MAG: hypothetical protein IKV88_00585 [Clostridia bacterium]|nr:hypothetical protein [Clostridia bacterium]
MNELMNLKKTEFENFSKSLPQTNNEKYKDAFEVANYMTWAYIIKNTGYIKNREAQRDTAYSWSANVFQFFVKNYLE